MFCKKEQKKDIYELQQIPLQTRRDFQYGHRYFLASRYNRYPDIEKLVVKRSFGLSGIPLEVYWDGEDEERTQAALWKFRKEHFNITSDEKCCIFCMAEYAGNKIMDYMPAYLNRHRKTLSFPMRDLSLERMKACAGDIFTFGPIWMRLAPGMAVMLADTMAANGLLPLPGLRYIELSGETLDERTEHMIRNAFCVPISNVYATKGTGPIAASCKQRNLHIFSENVEIQVIRDGKPVVDEEGDIYLTSRQNNAMLPVRMKTGDRGILQSMPCACGQSAPVLHLTKCRNCSFITTVSGRKISALMLRSMAEYTNEEVSRCLAHIRFRQTGYDSMDVILGIKPAFTGWEREAARVLCSQIQDPELKQMKWNFLFVKPDSAAATQMEEQPFFVRG